MCTKIVPFYDLPKTQLTTSFNLLVLNFLYSFFSSLHVIFFHEGVHGGQLDLPAKISIYTAVSYGGILKFFRRVPQLNINKYKKQALSYEPYGPARNFVGKPYEKSPV